MRKKKNIKITKIRKRPKKKRFLLRYKHHYRMMHIFVVASLIIAFGVLIFFLIKKTILSPKYTIGNVQYNEESVKTYDDPHIYKAVSQAFLWKNYYRTQWFGIQNITKDIQRKYPLVKKIEIQFINDQTIQVTLLFHDPILVFRTPSQRVAVYQDHLYPLIDKNLLAKNTLQIDLPRYSSGFDNLHGVLYTISAEKIKKITRSIYDTLWEKNINEFTYLPWWQLIFLRYKGKQVYLNIKQNIDAQLIKLIDLENRYPQFSTLNKIDVGSTDDIIVK